MATKWKVHSAGFNAQIALAALKGDKTVNELAGHYGVHPTLIHVWKKHLVAGAEGLFARPGCSSRSAGSRWSWSGSEKAAPFDGIQAAPDR